MPDPGPKRPWREAGMWMLQGQPHPQILLYPPTPRKEVWMLSGVSSAFVLHLALKSASLGMLWSPYPPGWWTGRAMNGSSCHNQGFPRTLMEGFGGDPSNIFSRGTSALGCVNGSSSCHFLLTQWHCQYRCTRL